MHMGAPGCTVFGKAGPLVSALNLLGRHHPQQHVALAVRTCHRACSRSCT